MLRCKRSITEIFILLKAEREDYEERGEDGKILKADRIVEKFVEYFGTPITSAEQLETLLKQNDNWFNAIFIDNMLP